ncbi:MAG: transcriptional repressor LexA [Clostridia bacterium]|nr:transcriptional repressor LexA [Clostridia bacterium]
MRRTNAKLYDLLEYIDDCQKRDYYSPSIREMCDYIGVSSTCTVAYYIKKLCDIGLLSKENLKSRALKILKPKEEWAKILNISSTNFIKCDFSLPTIESDAEIADTKFIPVPLIGKVTAGLPILAHEEYDDVYNLPYSLFCKHDLFMLNVKGESMIKAGINDGDKIVVTKQNTADNGDIVVALVEDSATVKRFYKENGRFKLQPENDTMQPIYCDEVTILGKVVGLIRQF